MHRPYLDADNLGNHTATENEALKIQIAKINELEAMLLEMKAEN